MEIKLYKKLGVSAQIVIPKAIRDSLGFPVGCTLEIHATDKTNDGKPEITIRKFEK